MAQFFRTVGDFITLIYKYIAHLLQSILAIPQLFDSIGDFLEQCLFFVPAEITIFVVVIVMLCALLFLIGR